MYSLQALGTRLPGMTAPWFALTGSGPVEWPFQIELSGSGGVASISALACQYSQLPYNILVISGARY